VRWSTRACRRPQRHCTTTVPAVAGFHRLAPPGLATASQAGGIASTTTTVTVTYGDFNSAVAINEPDPSRSADLGRPARQMLLGPAQRLGLPRFACVSIAASSSAVNVNVRDGGHRVLDWGDARRADERRGDRAPAEHPRDRERRASVWCRLAAISLSALMWSRLSSVSRSGDSDFPGWRVNPPGSRPGTCR